MNETSVDHIEELFTNSLRISLYTIFGIICILAVFMNLIVIHLYNTRMIHSSNFNLCLAHLSGMNIAESLGILPFVFVDVSALEKKSKYIDNLRCGITDGMCGFFTFAFGCVWCIGFMSVSRLAIIRKPLACHLQKELLTKFSLVFGFLVQLHCSQICFLGN